MPSNLWSSARTTKFFVRCLFFSCKYQSKYFPSRKTFASRGGNKEKHRSERRQHLELQSYLHKQVQMRRKIFVILFYFLFVSQTFIWFSFFSIFLSHLTARGKNFNFLCFLYQKKFFFLRLLSGNPQMDWFFHFSLVSLFLAFIFLSRASGWQRIFNWFALTLNYWSVPPGHNWEIYLFLLRFELLARRLSNA